MRRTDTETSARWGAPRWLGWFGWILLAATVAVLLVGVVLERGVTWGTLGRLLPVVSAVGIIVLARIGTRITAGGVETTGRGVRVVEVPWDQVTDVQPDKPNRWADVLQAHLLDGSVVPLQGVPPSDLPRVQEFRDRAPQ